MANTINIGVRASTEQATKELAKLEGKVEDVGKAATSTAKSSGWQSVLMGVGMSAGFMAMNAAKDAIGAVTVALQDGVQGAIEEEASLARLDKAISTNVESWDGNMDAISKVIAERGKLGFSDDEQRDSLAKLVVATGDVTEALDIQRTAMDLARLKGISLASAADIVVRATQGQTRGLLDLGITVQSVGDKTKILGEIQRVAGGQAEAYGQTTAGAMEIMQVSMDELAEQIGAELLPALKTISQWVVSDGIPAVNDFIGAMGHLAWAMQYQKDNADTLAFTERGLAGVWFDSKQSAAAYEQAMLDQAAATALSKEVMARYIEAYYPKVKDATNETSAATDYAAVSVALMGAAYKKTWSELGAAAQGAADAIYGPALRAIEWQAKQEQIAAEKERIADDTLTAEKIQHAKDRLVALRAEGLGIQIEMAGRGELAEGSYEKLIALLVKQSKSGSAEIANAAQAALLQLRNLKLEIINMPSLPGSGMPGLGGRAAGGPVSRGSTYLVGERGPEWFVPGSSGTIIPNTRGGGLTLAAGAIVVNGSGDPEAVARSVMLALKRETLRQGMTL
jgi:hypothetical protein